MHLPSVSTFTFPSKTEPVFTASTSEPVFESPNHSQTSQTTQSQQLQQYHTTIISNNNPKFPYLKKEEYEDVGMRWSIGIMNKHIAVQRETKARTILLQSLPEIIMADFHHLDDARDIWLAFKARFGEGLHKGYDRFQKILSQLNQMQAKPDNEDCNMKFLRALPPSWTIEIDVKGGSSYDSRGTHAPTHSAFISAASTNSKMSYPKQSHYTTFTSASSSPAASSNIGKLDLEELDIKWQMAMLSVRINRFEKKAGRR
ncbi:hypothetical protein Tco_0977608 [Tanacetum coccineum]|uniref:Uncharacterized protein n=1 Tax=Tanacetum coccineum TaxID=301880 RepID=A0ABQ5EKK6_9ASTR